MAASKLDMLLEMLDDIAQHRKAFANGEFVFTHLPMCFTSGRSLGFVHKSVEPIIGALAFICHDRVF